jgi:16S rRNA (guanine527-N7)-methyltransferase
VNDVSRETSAAQEHYRTVPGLSELVEILATTGVERGLIGPREASRLWSRHIANCAVVAESTELVPCGSSVIDVGSGAGLPGLVWALVRPDLNVMLVEPLLRRANFLGQAVVELGLGDRVTVERSRAEDYSGPRADVVTARAVAPLAVLVGWTLPLTRIGGLILALKGTSASSELAAAATEVRRAGGGLARVELLSGPGVDPPTTVVVIERVGPADGKPRRSPKRG